MKQIPATLGFVALVDDEDFECLARFRWYAHNNGGEKRPARRTSVQEGRKVRFLHHHIIRPPEGMVVDHINGDPWDNRRCNLRICTNAENVRNRRKHAGRCKNLFKGVYRQGRRHVARIRFKGEDFFLGRYDTPEAAALAYDAAALYLHGEFARLNFPFATSTPKSPQELVAQASSSRDNAREAAVSQVFSGRPASHVARDLAVSTGTVCRWARDAGLKLSRGRPRLQSPAPESAAA